MSMDDAIVEGQAAFERIVASLDEACASPKPHPPAQAAAVSGGGELLPQGEIVQHKRPTRAREGANPPEDDLEKEKHRKKMRALLCFGKRRQ